jgi:hypothetical protein
MSGSEGQEATFVADVFRSVHEALKSVADQMPDHAKPGF